MNDRFGVEHPYTVKIQEAVRFLGVCEGCPAMQRPFQQVANLDKQEQIDATRTDQEIARANQGSLFYRFAQDEAPDLSPRELAHKARETAFMLTYVSLGVFKKSLDQQPCAGGLTPEQAEHMHPFPYSITSKDYDNPQRVVQLIEAMMQDDVDSELPTTASGRVCEVELRILRQDQTVHYAPHQPEE